jgi:hypothetical protein
MRISNDERLPDGRLLNGYDYERQAWVKDGRYIRCGHPESMPCGCYGKAHAGELTQPSEAPHG